jgi:hypothetical protein
MPELTALPVAPTTTITAPTHFSADHHIAPQYDPLEYLPAGAADKLRALRQRSADAHKIVPEFESVREASMARINAENALARLVNHPQEHGFGLKPDNRSVIEAQRTLDKATADFKRLQELQEVRAAAWRSASGALAAVEEWLRNGRPGGTALEAVEAEPPSFLKAESLLDGIERLRRRGRELRADLARIAAAPFLSSHARAKIRQEVEALSMQGAPAVSNVIEHDRKIIWPTRRLSSQVISGEQRGIAFAEVPDVLALFAWTFKDQLIAKLDAEITAEADDAAALSHEDRQRRTAELMSDLLEAERAESALVWLAQAQNLPCEHRLDCSPLAILNLRLITVPRAAINGPSTTPDAYDFVLAGR